MTVEAPVLEVDAQAAPAAVTAPVPEPLRYQWVLCDDHQIHAVSDDVIHCSAHADGAEPWEGICRRPIALHHGRPEPTDTICWRCIDAIPANAVQAPWKGRTL